MRDSFCEDFVILKAIERLMLSVLEVSRVLLLWKLVDRTKVVRAFVCTLRVFSYSWYKHWTSSLLLYLLCACLPSSSGEKNRSEPIFLSPLFSKRRSKPTCLKT